MDDLAQPITLIALACYAAMSAVTFCAYGLDKRAAIRETWRIKERTLHTLDLLCGWPGGLAAQQLFKHKRRKAKFMLVFWASVALHLVLWAIFAWLWISG